MGRTAEEFIASLPTDSQARVHEEAERLIAGEFLRQLRHMAELSEEEVATRMGIRQDNISGMEQRKDIHLSTLFHYVNSLGGELTLTVNFPGHPQVFIMPPQVANLDQESFLKEVMSDLT